MKIKSLKVDGFGVWSKLKIDGLDEGIHVFHGPNEAGKTTLMQFLRSMFFGFTPDRQHYLPPVHGGRPGGAVDLDTPEGSFSLSRHNDDQSPGPRASGVLSAPDGTRHGESYVQSLLSGTDESTFNNVFTVGLREIQELATLDDTEAASLLFSLTAGLDRVSLVDVMRELATSRRRLLSDDGSEGQIAQLYERRQELLQGIHELDSLTSQYGQLTSQRNALARDAELLGQKREELEHTGRVLEAAVSLRERWNQRGQLDAQLASYDISTAGLEEAFERFEQTDRRLVRLRKRIAQVEKHRRQIRRRYNEIEVNESLHRQAARIEAFREQESWINSLRSKVAELENESRQLEEQKDVVRSELGLETDARGQMPTELGRADSAGLRRAGRSMRKKRELLADAKAHFEQCSQKANEQSAELQNALSAQGIGDLNTAIESTGTLVSQLRRHTQLAERIAQMERNETELDERVRDLLGRQVMPLPTVIGLGAVFVLCAIMIVVGLFMSRLTLTSLGFVGILVAIGAKIMIDRANARKLDACQKQLEMVQSQITQAKQEYEQLEKSLPPSASRDVQLETAQKNLNELEELTPVDARRRGAEQEVETASQKVNQCEDEYRSAKRQWAEALSDAGLPKGLSPKQVKKIWDHREKWGMLVRRSEQVTSELRLRQGELDSISDRITQLATEAAVPINSGNPVELLHTLNELLRQEQSRIEQRKELQRKARRLRRSQAKLNEKVRPLRLRRRKCLDRLGVHSGDELRRRREMLTQAAQLQRQRHLLQAEIENALSGQCTEAELAACLAETSDEDLEARWDAIERELQTIRTQIEECHERRGQLKAQLDELAADRRGARKRLELGTIDQRLAQLVRRWQVLALTGRILSNVKDLFETQRQPETLQEASEYLRRLTGGRYTRVWTPLGEDVLKVDDARGESLPVEVLSRGTREQLFLALRLALVSCYSRRGVRLPLILDDVLVNYDTPRAKSAASLLRDFAREGHQLLVFTCHDHILSLFKSLKVDVRRLPNHRETAAGEGPTTRAKKTKRASKPAKRKQGKKRKRPDDNRLEEEITDWEEEQSLSDEPIEAEEEDESSWEDAVDDEDDENRVEDAA